MRKGNDAYRSIGETAQLVGVATHVLRYWETQFPQLKPIRRPDGRRYYRPDDVRFAAALARILHDEGMTTRGATRIIRREGLSAMREMGAERLSARSSCAPSPSGTVPPRTDSTPQAVPAAAVPMGDYLARLTNLSQRLRHEIAPAFLSQVKPLADDLRRSLAARSKNR